MGKLAGFNPDISLFLFILNRRGEHGIFARVHRHLNRVRPTFDFCTTYQKRDRKLVIGRCRRSSPLILSIFVDEHSKPLFTLVIGVSPRMLIASMFLYRSFFSVTQV